MPPPPNACCAQSASRSGRHPQRPAPVTPVRQQGDQDLSGLRRVLRPGRRIEQVVSYFRHAAQGLEEKKQILYLLGPVGGGKSSIAERKAEVADAGGAVLRDQGFAGERIAARPVRSGRRRRHTREGIRHSAPLPQPRPVAVGGKTAGRIRRRHPQVQGGQALSQRAQAGRHRQDRTGRREQSGHFESGRQG
jgi:hypothetical protein